MAYVIGLIVGVGVWVFLSSKNRNKWEDIGETNIQNSYAEFINYTDLSGSNPVSYEEYKTNYSSYNKTLKKYKKDHNLS